MLGFINSEWAKSFIYLAGVILAMGFGELVGKYLIKNKIDGNKAVCNIVDLGSMGNYKSPAISTLMIAFTLAYILVPMVTYNNFNYPFLISIGILMSIDASYKVKNECSSPIGIILGIVLGGLLGLGWFSIFASTGDGNLVFFGNKPSNNTVCSKAGKSNFKCRVYKNGELLTN
jgi:hypothetical protein